MFHKLPPPLKNRVFNVLLLSGVYTDPSSPEKSVQAADHFTVIQLPIDLASFPEEFRKRSHYDTQKGYYRPPDSGATDTQKAQRGNKIVEGRYVSVENVARGQDSESPMSNVWTMSTASDAGGVLPMAIQKLAIPGQIAKDVQFVMDYINKHRNDVGWPK